MATLGRTTVSKPIRSAALPAARAPDATPKSVRPRVLVVEDDDLVANALVRATSAFGWLAELKHTAQEACAALDDATGWAALVVDVGLPRGANGFDVAKHARARRRGLPILVMTGEDSRTVANEAQLLGCELLFKPFETGHVRAFLDRARPAPALERLSPQERAIVELIRGGRSRKDAARELGVSENTLKTHTKRLLAKTGAPTVAVLCARLSAAMSPAG